MIVYKATNIKNNKIYIGQTTHTLDYRKKQHFRDAKRVDRPNTYFYNAIMKYGENNFIFEIIDSTKSLEELNKKEQYWIKFYNSTNKTIGYNLDSGGANCKKSEATKRKIGDTTIQKWNNPIIAQKMRAGLNKATQEWIIKSRAERVEWICPVCGNKLLLPKHMTKNKKACSRKCGGYNEDSIKSLQKLGIEKHRKNIESKQALSIIILDWCKDNKEIVLNCPYNKITTTLQPLFDYINIKDIRTIFICFNVCSRKEFLKYLKDYLIKENIC